jgi:hypothetical protein
MNTINSNLPNDNLLQKLKLANIDLTVIEPLLDYAASVIECEIRDLRSALSKIAEPSLRHEYLARLESLQLVKSKLSIANLAHQIEKLTGEEQSFNVY